MSSFWNKRRKIYRCLTLLSAFIVFFVGWTFNSEKMERQLSLALDAVTNFRRGLDISGGTRLTYRISYDNYEQTYSGNAQALAEVKNTVENIILKNIDGRISKLGVSDYKSYTQQLDNETQIVVEIGGVADLDQAKELIGKTVELQFKLPNEEEGSEEEKLERKGIAENLYNDLLNNSDKFEAIAGGRDSENILYNRYDEVSLSQLPTIYQDNLGTLEETEEGKFSPLMEGEYYSYQYQDESGNVQNFDMDGYLFFHMISKEKKTRDEISLSDIIEAAKTLGISFDDKFTLVKEGSDIASGSYIIQGDTLKYNNGEVYENETAYDVRILEIIPNNIINFENNDTTINIQNDEENDEANIENEENNETTINIQNDEENNENNEENIESSKDEFTNKINEAKNALLTDTQAEIEDSTTAYEGVISSDNLKEAIETFDPSNTDTVQVYDVAGITYIVVIKDTKSESESWYNYFILSGINESEFNSTLESQTLYTLEEVFVQDKLSWVNAQSDNGKILNGANFKYAAVSTSQLGEPVVLINFDDTGKEIFCNITTNNIGKQMAIFIGGEMITSPVIQAKICDGSAQIDGNFTTDSAKELTSQLNEGALPAPLILMQEEKVSATLGENAFNGALIAMGVGFIVIFLYISFLYGFKKGLISLLSLSIYTVILFAIVKIIDYALSLSGIAAVILSIGMAVDANVLIFERMKEEKANKKSDEEAINVAYDRSWNAIRDGQISTGMIGLLLMLMGINMFKGFGTMLVVGVLLTLLVNAPVIKELLHIFYKKK